MTSIVRALWQFPPSWGLVNGVSVQVLASVHAGVCIYVLVHVSCLHCIPTPSILFCDAWQFQRVNPMAGGKEQSKGERK